MTTDRWRDRLYQNIGGPLTRWDWVVLGLITGGSIFMGLMTPVWMHIASWL